MTNTKMTILLLASAAAVLPQAAMAQTQASNGTPPETQTATTDTGQIPDIIVTAQHRSERLQDVPVSVQVITNQTIVQQNRNTLGDLTQTVPGVHIGSGGEFTTAMYVRGIGSGGNPAFDQSVAMFIDDVYFGRSRATGAAFLDLDRIEILKGPQSTFFGNNAIAGALNLITKKPGDTFEASGRALYGSFGQYAVEGETTVPVSDKFSVRIAGTTDGGRGWIHNVTTGERAPKTRNYVGRVTAVYRPTDDLDITIKGEGSHNKIEGTDQGNPLQYTDCPAPAPIGANMGGVFCALALANGVPQGINQNSNAGLGGQGSDLKAYNGTATVNYHKFGLTFTSVSAYNGYHYTSRGDQVNVGTFLNTHSQDERYHQFSQEFRVSSPTGNRFEWMAGGYFQSDRIAQNFELNAPFVNALGPLLGIPSQYLPLAWKPGFVQNEKVYSLFGQATYAITDKLKIGAGVRSSWVDKTFSGYNQYGTSSQVYGGFTPIPLQYAVLWTPTEGTPGVLNGLKRSDRNVMPSARLQYQFSRSVMAYFSYSRGFKAGGFNGAQPFNSADNLEFGPEHVNAYELGVKSRLFDNHVLFNIDVFRSDYSALQENASVFQPATNSYTSFIRNAAASRSQGVEVEAEVAVTRNLRISGNVTYLDSKFISFPNASPTVLQSYCATNYVLPYCGIFPRPVPAFANYAGQKTDYAPSWSGSLKVDYTYALPGDLKLTTELSPYFTTKYNEQNAPYVPGTSGYVRLDARISLEAPGGRWAVDLIGKNLTNRDILDTFGIYATSKEEPRNVAVQLRFNY